MGIWASLFGITKSPTRQPQPRQNVGRGEYVSPYLPSERFDELLSMRRDGMPPLCLVRYRGALWLREDSTGLLVNVGNRKLRQLGIWSATVRGTKYYDQRNVRIGPVALVREPDNPHDKNAVSIQARGASIGHFNKQMAPGVAKVLDSGQELTAYVVSCGEENPTKVIAAHPSIMMHLLRRIT